MFDPGCLQPGYLLLTRFIPCRKRNVGLRSGWGRFDLTIAFIEPRAHCRHEASQTKTNSLKGAE